MRLLHFAKESYIVYRLKGMPVAVAEIQTRLETMKYLIVTCHKENIAPTEEDVLDNVFVNSGQNFVDLAENEFQIRINKKSNLKILN